MTPAELEAALRGAYGDRIDAAVAAGKLTKEQADALKKRSAQGALPLFGGPRIGDWAVVPASVGRHRSRAAATYLGLTQAELRTQLESGKSLAEIAKAQGKSVDGLTKALSAELKKKLDAAVKDGKLTQAQADEIESRMTEHLDDIVNGTGGPGRPHDGHGWGGPPPMSRHRRPRTLRCRARQRRPRGLESRVMPLRGEGPPPRPGATRGVAPAPVRDGHPGDGRPRPRPPLPPL